MSFLKCLPSVFVIGKEYEILINVNQNGLCAIEIDGVSYYEDNAGALSTEKTYAKIRVPQSVLNAARGYTVSYRRSVNRRAYFSELGPKECEHFPFKPLEKEEDIHIYHVSDVHYAFEQAVQMASFFGEALDLLVVNGDIGEVETEDNYFEVCRFVGEIAHGEIPVVFVRGNHDTRGHLAERFTDFFPANGKQTYYSFELGCLRGIVLDCGEDKPDASEEYGGVNDFEGFRRRETAFLESLVPAEGKLTFAVSHICPAQNTRERGVIFDIEDEVYRIWNDELARLGVRFMLSGHIHKTYILEPNDERSLRPHSYPVVVGSERAGHRREGALALKGAAMTLDRERLTVRFTDRNRTVCETHVIEFKP